ADIDTLTGLFSIIIPGFCTDAGHHRFEAADIDRRLSILIGFDDTVIDPVGENFASILLEENDGSCNYHRDTEQSQENSHSSFLISPDSRLHSGVRVRESGNLQQDLPP